MAAIARKAEWQSVDIDFASHIEVVARHLLGEPNKALTTRNELRFGSKGSLSVKIDNHRCAGTWYCFETPIGGGVLDLIVREGQAKTLFEAREWLTRLLGNDPPARPVRKIEDKHEAIAARKRRLAFSIWRETVPAPGTLVDLWLRDRGIRWAIHGNIRCHRMLPYFHDEEQIGKYPAMVVRMDDADANFAGIHITWLSPGGDKAPVPSPRKMLGTNGIISAAWLARRDVEAVVIGEGVESALSASELGGQALPPWGCCNVPDSDDHQLQERPPEPWGFTPVVAGNAGNLAKFVLPPTLRRIFISEDNDDEGRRACATLCKRARTAGIHASILRFEGGY